MANTDLDEVGFKKKKVNLEGNIMSIIILAI